MKPLSVSLSLFASLALCPLLKAQNEAFTDPVGFVSVTVPAQSDAVLAVPLNRAAAFRGVVQSISGNVLTISGSPGWSASQFVQSLPAQPDSFALLIASGHPTTGKEGMIAKITANGSNTITVQLDAGDSLAGIGTVDVPLDPDDTGPLAPQADQIDIVPYWTPRALLGTTLALADNSELQLFPKAIAGQNLSAAKILVYFNNFGWFDSSDFSDANDLALDFGAGVVIRNVGASASTISMVGSVPMSRHRLGVRTLANNVAQDTRLGYLSPVPETIGNTGLGFENFDELHVFNNSATGYNKSAAQILVYADGSWYDSSDFSNVTATFQLQPGFGYLYRKAATISPQRFVWSKLQSYLQ